MIAMALIHLCFGGDSPLGYVKNEVLLFFSATTALSNTMSYNDSTKQDYWKDFSQYISKHMALKVYSLKYFERCISYRQVELLFTLSTCSASIKKAHIEMSLKCQPSRSVNWLMSLIP